jgi:HK97 family phage prohead protease
MKKIMSPAGEHREFPLAGIELRYAAGPGVIRLLGHAAIFDAVADLGRHRERIARGAFKDTIANDDIRALINHNPQYVLGRTRARTLKLAEDDKGLAVTIDLPDTSYARDLVESIRRGDVSGMSIGFTALDDVVEEDADGAMVRTLKRVKLHDVSPVTFPIYPQTDMKARDSGRLGRLRRRMELEL